MESNKLAEIVLSALKERKAFDIVKINVSEKTSVADYFIIASARSSTQVKSLSEHVEMRVEENGYRAIRKEGLTDARWVILDFGDVIVHIFNDETRLFYHIERLWGEGEKIENQD